jgi:hypothetical protein
MLRILLFSSGCCSKTSVFEQLYFSKHGSWKRWTANMLRGKVRQSVFMYVEAYYNRIRRTLVRCIRYLTIFRLLCLTQVESLNGVYQTGQSPISYQWID